MARTWWAALALLAVFAMHGLATHAGASEPVAVVPTGTTTVATAVAAVSSHAGHHLADLDVPAPAASLATVVALDDRGNDGGHAMQVLGLCVAVLATAAIGLLRLLRPAPGVLAVRPPAVRLTTTPAAAADAHAPPDLHALSILRC